MAQVRWYLNSTTIDGWQLLDQSAATAATLPNGWVVGTGLTNSSEFASGAAGDRASTTFVGNTVPDGTLDTTLKDAMRSQFAWTGSFPAANWTFQFAVVSTVQAGAADGQIVFRVLKANADGSSATQITTGQVATTVATNVGATDVNITATWAAPAWTITNQYIFVQVAWKRTGAGGMTTTNIRLRTGSSTTVGTTGLTADFTPGDQAVTVPHIASTASHRIVAHGTPDGTQGGGSAGVNVAQTISGISGELSQIDLYIGKIGTPTDNVYVTVHQSTFNGTLLATSSSVAMSSVLSGGGWKTFTFASPVSLSAATTYWLQVNLSRSVTDSSNYAAFWFTVAAYADGDGYNNTGSSIGFDFAFRLYLSDRAPNIFSLLRLNGTGKVVAGNTGTTVQSIALTLSPAPAVGNAVIVTLSVYDQGASFIAFSATECQDNQGNTYALAFSRNNQIEFGVAVYYCKVYNSSGTFTITYTGPTAGAPYRFMASAVEIGGDGMVGKLLSPVSSVGSQQNATVLYSTPNTASISGEAIMAAVLTRVHFEAATITVENVGWTQEAEDLTTTGVQGEHDTRIAVLGGTTRAQWALSPSGNVGGMISVFQTVNEPGIQSVTGTTIAAGSFAWTDALLLNYPGSGTGAMQGAAGRNNVQTYTAQYTSVLANIGVRLQRFNNPTDELYFVIRDALDGTALATTNSVSAAGLTDALFLWNIFQLQTPLPITKGTTYWIEAYTTRSSTDLSNSLLWAYGSGAVGAWGEALTSTGAPFNGGGYDFSIALYSTVFSVALNVSGQTVYSTARIPYTETLLLENYSNVNFGSTSFGTAGYSLGQTLSGHSGTLSSVSLFVRYLAPIPQDALYLELRDSTLNGTLLATSLPVAGITIPSLFNWMAFAFPGAITLNAGTTYWLKVLTTRPTSAAGQGQYDVGFSTASYNVYTGGEAKDSAGNTFIGPGRDLAFRLYTGSSHTVAIEVPADQAVTSTTITAGSNANQPSLATTIVTAGLVSHGLVSSDNESLILSSEDYGDLYGEYAMYAQSFTTAARFSALDIKLAVDPAATGTIIGDLYLGGDPNTGTLITTGTLSAPPLAVAPFPTYRYVRFTFPTVDPGGSPTPYTFVMRRSADDWPIRLPYATDPSVEGAWYWDGNEDWWLVGPPGVGERAFLHRVIGESVFAPTVAHAVVGAQTIEAAFIGGALVSDDLLLEDGSFALLEDGTGHLLLEPVAIGAAQLFAPSVGVSQTIETAPIPVGSITRSATVTVGPVTVAGSTRLSTAQTFVVTVATGPVGVTSGTRPATSAVSIPSVAVGAVTISAATRPLASVATAPSVAAVATGATIASSSGTFPPAVALTVLTTPRAPTSQLFTPTVAPPTALVTTGTVATTAQSFSASVMTGAVTIGAATRLTTAQVFVVSLLVGPVAIGGGTVSSTAQLQTATVTAQGVAVTGSSVPGTAQTFVPAVTVGAFTISGTTRATTIQVFAPALTTQTLGATIGSGSGTFAPAVALTVLVPSRAATSAVFVPTLGLTVTGATLASGSIARVPTVAPGFVTVGGVTVPSVSLVRVPAITVGPASVSGAFLPTTVQPFVVTVTTGPVTVGGSTRASTSQTFVSSVTPGAITITGATRPLTSQTFVLSVAVGSVTVSGATSATAALLFTPALTAVEAGAIGAATIPTTALVHPLTVVGGLAIIVAPVIGATSVARVPSVAVGAVTILGAFVGVPVATLPAPLAYWPLDEGTGTTSVDASGNGHDLTITFDGGVWDTTLEKFGAAALRGSGLNLSMASFNVIDLGSTHSIACWINGWDGLDDGVIIGGFNGHYAFYIDAAAIYYSAQQANYVEVFHGGLTGSHHLCVTRSGATVQFYKDGAPLGTGTTLGTAGNELLLEAIGAYSAGGFPFGGTVDDVRLYATRLTDAQVAELYALDPSAVGGAVVFAPTVAPLPVTITGATRPATSQPFAPVLAPRVVSAPLGSTVAVFSPSLGLNIATAPRIPTTSGLFVPSLATGAVTVGAATSATTAQVFEPAISVGGTAVVGTHLATTAQVFAPTVAAGTVTISGGTRSATSQVFAPVLTVITTGATIVSGSGTFAPSVALTITTATIPATSQVFLPIVAAAGITNIGATTISAASLVRVPSVGVGTVTILVPPRATTELLFAPALTVGPITITGATRPATSLVFAPTLAVGPVTIFAATRPSTALLSPPALTSNVTGGTRASASVLFPPAALPIGALGGPTQPSTLQLFAPSVATGAVTVVAGTVARTSQVFVPEIAVGVTSITGATRGTTAVLYAPSFVARLDGTFIVSGTTLFAPTVKLTQFVTSTLLPSGTTLFAPAVGVQIGGPTRLTTAQVFAPPLITTGAITVIGGTVPIIGSVHPPAVLVGAVTITVPHRASTLAGFAPTVAMVVGAAHLTSTAQLFIPSVTPGAVTVGAPTISSTVQTFPPTVGVGITTATLASASLPFAPTLLPQVTTPLWIVSTVVFPPSALPLGEVLGPTAPSTLIIFPPFMVAYAPPAEIHDFVVAIARGTSAVVDVCRLTTGTVAVTCGITQTVTIDRTVAFTAKVIQAYVLTLGVER